MYEQSRLCTNRAITAVWLYFLKRTIFRSGRTTFPPSFEDLDQEHGFVMYEHTVVSRFRDPALLDLTDSVRDRALVFVNRRKGATLTRAEMEKSPVGGGLKQGNGKHAKCSL